MTDPTTILLVHGAWHGPWVWAGVEASLAARGIATRTVALPSCSDRPDRGGLAEDVAAIEAAAALSPAATMVVGHSYAGVPMSAARYGAAIRDLVFIAAIMPSAGRSLVSYLPGGPPPYARFHPDGSLEFVAGLARDCLYNDLDPAAAEAATARLTLHSAAAVTTPIGEAAWHQIRSTYVLCSDDRAVPPDMQRGFAAQADDVREIASSHSPMLSQPEALAGMLAAIAFDTPRHRPVEAPRADAGR